MYKTTNKSQEEAENFELPFGDRLSEENRWVKLAKLIPWSDSETEYASQFSSTMGASAKPFWMALGALIIKERLRTSDEETVEQIKENPYLQYFLGLSEYTNEAPKENSNQKLKRLTQREFDGIKKGQEVKQAILLVLNQEQVFEVDKCRQLTPQRG